MALGLPGFGFAEGKPAARQDQSSQNVV